MTCTGTSIHADSSRELDSEKLVNSEEQILIDTAKPSTKKKDSKRQIQYLTTAGIAALACAIGATLRGVASDTPYTSKFLLSFCYLILSSITLLFLKWRGGPEWCLPWWKEVLGFDTGDRGGQQGQRLVFDLRIFLLVIISGVLSAVASQFCWLSNYYAIKSNTN